MRKLYYNRFGKTNIVAIWVLSLLIVGGLTESSFGNGKESPDVPPADIIQGGIYISDISPVITPISDEALAAEFEDAYISERIAKMVDKIGKLDSVRAFIFKKMDEDLHQYGVSFSDIPGELRTKALSETMMIFKRNNVRMIVDASRLEANGANEKDLTNYFSVTITRIMEAWGAASVRWLITTGVVDKVVSEKQ